MYIRYRITSFKLLFIDFTVFFYHCRKRFGKGIYDWYPYTMQASWYLVSACTKLSSGMQYCKHRFKCRLSCLRVNFNRYTSTVIYYCYTVVYVNRHIDIFTISGKSLIYSIVHDFVNEVMQSFASCRAYIHTRPFPYRLQTFKYLYLLGTVFNIDFFFHIYLLVIKIHQYYDVKYPYNQAFLPYLKLSCFNILNCIYFILISFLKYITSTLIIILVLNVKF